jgi:hypothetical protein
MSTGIPRDGSAGVMNSPPREARPTSMPRPERATLASRSRPWTGLGTAARACAIQATHSGSWVTPMYSGQ